MTTPDARWSSNAIAGYVVAVLATAIAAMLRWLLDPWLGNTLPFVTLFAAVAVAAFFGGYGPALVATGLCFLAADYFFIEPRGTFSHPPIYLDLVLFLLTCGIIIALTERMRAAQRRAREQFELLHRSEQALRRSEEEFRDFFENVAVGLHWVGPDGTILRVNRTELDLLGYQREEYLGRNIAEFHVDPPVIENILARLTRGEALHEYPARLRCKDGSIRHVLINSNVLWEKGQFIHTRCLTRDVTEHLRTEASLQESRDVLSLAMRGGRMGAWSRDLATDAVWWSRELEEIFGLEPGGFEGTHAGYFAFIHDDDRPQVMKSVEAAIRSRTDYIMEFRFRHSSGEWRWMEGRGRAVYADDGSPRMLHGLGIDITERKRAEEALKEADRRKDVFLATLSHELRNPLAPVRNAIEVQKSEGATPADWIRTREIIDRQLHHMTRLVDDLLDASRISANKLLLRKELVDLAGVVESAVETSRPHIEAGDHQLTVSLPAEPIRLEADPIRLSQVLSNLLNNAARYTKSGGRISLVAEREVGSLLLTVTDNGAGIAPEMLPGLFEMFSQGAVSLEESQSGLGIGLSLARALIELHDGSIGVYSEGLGRGSQFTVRLPLGVSDDPVRGHELIHDRAAKEVAAKPRILIADDLRDAADSLAMLLRIEGHEVEVAYDGETALAAAERLLPALVLLDIGMPRMNGYEVARQIRTQPWGRGMFLIALTGWGNSEDRQRATEAGFDAHLVKPVAPDILKGIIFEMSVSRVEAGS